MLHRSLFHAAGRHADCVRESHDGQTSVRGRGHVGRAVNFIFTPFYQVDKLYYLTFLRLNHMRGGKRANSLFFLLDRIFILTAALR